MSVVVNGSNINIEVNGTTNVSIESDVFNVDVQPSVIYIDNSTVQPLRYKAILQQSGTNNPVPFVIENTISSDLEWEFTLASNYRLKSPTITTGLFPLGKTFFFVGNSIEGHKFNINHATLSGSPVTSIVSLMCSNVSPINSFTYLSVLIEIYP